MKYVGSNPILTTKLMFAYRVICRQGPEYIDVKDFKLLNIVR